MFPLSFCLVQVERMMRNTPSHCIYMYFKGINCFPHYKLMLLINPVWTRLSFYNIKYLHYAWYATFILVSLFDVNLYAINFAKALFVSYVFNRWYFCTFSFPLAGDILAINNVTWYINESCPICLISSFSFIHYPLLK